MAITCNGSNRQEGFEVFINGKQVEASIEADSFIRSLSVEAPITLGMHGESASFIGDIDDVRVYTRQLTATEVRSLYRRHQVQPKELAEPNP